MTTIKLLSTGLIAIAMLATSAVARENFAAKRRVIIRHTVNAPSSAPAGHWIIWEGIPVWFGPSVRGVPGHICDDGDNGRIC
jgi:type IV secretory pathway protease TraF